MTGGSRAAIGGRFRLKPYYLIEHLENDSRKRRGDRVAESAGSHRRRPGGQIV
jgi:hypothetical protein